MEYRSTQFHADRDAAAVEPDTADDLAARDESERGCGLGGPVAWD